MPLVAEARAVRPERGETWVIGTAEPEQDTPPWEPPLDAAHGAVNDGDEIIIRARCECCGFICPASFIADGLCQNCASGIHLPPDWGRCLDKSEIPPEDMQAKRYRRKQPEETNSDQPAEKPRGRGRRKQEPARAPTLREH